MAYVLLFRIIPFEASFCFVLLQAPLYWDLYAPKGLDSARICFTCHNFEYQGTASASDLGSCGLDVNQLNRPDRMQDHSSGDRVNPVKVNGLQVLTKTNPVTHLLPLCFRVLSFSQTLLQRCPLLTHKKFEHLRYKNLYLFVHRAF